MLLVTVTVASAVIEQAGASAAPVTGTLWGSATTATGAPIGGLTVTAYSAAYGNVVASATTGQYAGWYAFSSLPAGHYLISFTDPSGRWGTQWYPHALDAAASAAVTVTAGAATWAPVHLAPAGHLRGQIVRPQAYYKYFAVLCPIVGSVAMCPHPAYQVVVIDATNAAVVAVVGLPQSAIQASVPPAYAQVIPYQVGLAAGTYKVVTVALDNGWGGVPMSRPAFGAPGVDGALPVAGTPPGASDWFAAFAAAPTIHVDAGASTTSSPVLSGYSCDPATLHPGVHLAGQSIGSGDGSLERCDLHNADLTGSVVAGDYGWANLAGVSAAHADFTRAIFGSTDFTGADLTGATFAFGADQPITGGPARMIFNHTTCPDGTNSDNDAGTCDQNGLYPPVAPGPPVIAIG